MQLQLRAQPFPSRGTELDPDNRCLAAGTNAGAAGPELPARGEREADGSQPKVTATAPRRSR